MSEKRRKLMEEIGPAREAFKREFGACMACPLTNRVPDPNPILDVHEIARGAHRDEAIRDRRAWLLVCRECHEEMGQELIWPIARQYALKARCDPKFYDRVFLNHLRGRDAEAITGDEVAMYDATLQGEFQRRLMPKETSPPADLDGFLAFCDEWLALAEGVEGFDTETLKGIRNWVRGRGHLTPRQTSAVENIVVTLDRMRGNVGAEDAS